MTLNCASLTGCDLIGVDIMFLLDSSGSIDRSEYTAMLAFVESTINEFDIGPTQTRIGITVYSNNVETSILLNTYQDKDSLITQGVHNLPYFGQRTNTAAGLQTVLDVGFREGNGVRPPGAGIPRVLFVLTDGVSNDFGATVSAANRIHDQTPMIEVFAVGIGDGINEEELKAIATSPENFILQEGFEDFQSLINQLREEACSSKSCICK